MEGRKLCAQGLAWAASTEKIIDQWNHSWIPILLPFVTLFMECNEYTLKVSKIWNDTSESGENSLYIVILNNIVTKANSITLKNHTKDIVIGPFN